MWYRIPHTWSSSLYKLVCCRKVNYDLVFFSLSQFFFFNVTLLCVCYCTVLLCGLICFYLLGIAIVTKDEFTWIIYYLLPELYIIYSLTNQCVIYVYVMVILKKYRTHNLPYDNRYTYFNLDDIFFWCLFDNKLITLSLKYFITIYLIYHLCVLLTLVGIIKIHYWIRSLFGKIMKVFYEGISLMHYIFLYYGIVVCLLLLKYNSYFNLS